MTVPAELIKISNTIWKLPTSHKRGMLVPARIYATGSALHVCAMLIGVPIGLDGEHAENPHDHHRLPSHFGQNVHALYPDHRGIAEPPVWL